jgi:hypothetical protein
VLLCGQQMVLAGLRCTGQQRMALMVGVQGVDFLDGTLD